MSTLLTRTEAGILLIYFQDVRIIDERRISSLGQELNDLINTTDNERVILNFQHVSFMSSAMIGKLVEFEAKCKTAKIELRLCNINENVEEVFNLMRLNKLFTIDPDEETALKHFSKKKWFGS